MKLFMKKAITLVGFISQLFSAKAQQDQPGEYPAYNGNDLGLTYTSRRSVFRIWAPTAQKAELLLYHAGAGNETAGSYPMRKDTNGTWTIAVNGNKKGLYYVFRVMNGNAWLNEVPDPYAKAVGVNGKRGMIINRKETNPAGWEKDKSPEFLSATDAIIYELHIRDASIAPNSGIKNKGKFIGLTERGTINEAGLSTGLDHLKELRITHVPASFI